MLAKTKTRGAISFTEWINYGLLRHATVEGLRNDQKSHSVIREAASGYATRLTGRERFATLGS